MKSIKEFLIKLHKAKTDVVKFILKIKDDIDAAGTYNTRRYFR